MRGKKLMRTGLWLVLCGAIAFPTGGCKSPTPEAPAPAGQPAGVNDAPMDIASEFKKSTAAWNAGDLDGFMTIYAENATFAQRDRFVSGKRAIYELYGPLFAPGAERPTLVLERLDIEELSGGVALIRGIYRNSREGAVIGRGTTTLILKRINGRWRIAHDHST
jgi:uncharacterized protein (TIGR02246 family)